MEIAIPEINSKNGLRLYDDDVNIYLQSLKLFAANIPKTLNKMQNVAENTLSDYTVNIHGLKSMCEYIGAEKAGAAAKELEDLSKNGKLKEVLARNDNFIKSIETLISNINTWLKNNG